MVKDNNILLVGCGKMGSALARGWIKNNIPNISTLNPDDIDPDISNSCINVYNSSNIIDTTFDTIVLAVKPQILDTVCKEVSNVKTDGTLIISIAAGKSLSTIEGNFSDNQSVVRTMPNLPSSIGLGITVCIKNEHCTPEQVQIATTLMDSVGSTEWIENEEQMDAVTALSGSGPAYLFHLVEAMTNAGTNMGLSNDLSQKLARQTIIGSAHLLEQSTHSASELREQVTSKGGTTQAALDVLMKGSKFENIMEEAINAAQLRSKELS